MHNYDFLAHQGMSSTNIIKTLLNDARGLILAEQLREKTMFSFIKVDFAFEWLWNIATSDELSDTNKY